MSNHHSSNPKLDLSHDEVHVWQADLKQPAEVTKRMATLLSEDEKTRAQRFRFERDQMRFSLARAGLRLLLGRYLDQPPSAIRLTYNEHGKPFLAHGSDGLVFNLAHSGDRVAYAFSQQRQLGIDIEFVRDQTDIEAIVGRYFSVVEQAEFAIIPVEKRLAAFYRGWCRKEAFIKAKGLGLFYALDQFSVSLDAQPRLLEAADENLADWGLFELTTPSGYAGALAVGGCLDKKPLIKDNSLIFFETGDER